MIRRNSTDFNYVRLFLSSPSLDTGEKEGGGRDRNTKEKGVPE